MERKDSQITRRPFIKTLPPLIAGGVIAAGAGSLITSFIFGKRIKELLNLNEEQLNLNAKLLEVSGSQAEDIAELLRKLGALEVEVRAKKSEAQAAETKLSETTIEATQTAFDLLEYRVQATAEAYQLDQEALQEIMGKMPPSLIRNSIKILGFGQPFNQDNLKQMSWLTLLFEASGVVTYHDRAGGKLIFLTAGHALSNLEGHTLSKVGISQPHLDERGYVCSVESAYTHPESDLGIVTIDTQHPIWGPQTLPEDALDGVRIDEAWKPIIGEELYSLSFPNRARSGIGFTPSVFKVVGKEDGGSMAITDSLVGSGGSGAPVAKADGTVVGIYLSVGKQGNFVLPIGGSYRELLEGE